MEFWVSARIAACPAGQNRSIRVADAAL